MGNKVFVIDNVDIRERVVKEFGPGAVGSTIEYGPTVRTKIYDGFDYVTMESALPFDIVDQIRDHVVKTYERKFAKNG